MNDGRRGGRRGEIRGTAAGTGGKKSTDADSRPAEAIGGEPNGVPGRSKPRTGPNPAGSAAAKLPGGLYVVATPFGNAADITVGELEVLARADLVD